MSRNFTRVESDLQLRRAITRERTVIPTPEEHAALLAHAESPEDVNPLTLKEVSSDPLAIRVTRVVNVSLWVNIALLLAKLWAFLMTHSRAVMASLSDSFVDIACQGIIYGADRARNKPDPTYPVGRARLESMGVILCAVTMSLTSAAVIQFSAWDLYDGFIKANVPVLAIDVPTYVLLVMTIATKLALYLYCAALAQNSDVAMALAVDHRNDVVSNTASLLAAALAANYGDRMWWADAGGAILVSIYIIHNWVGVAGEQIARMVGMGAPEDFVQGIAAMARQQHPHLLVDCVRAYHFGSELFVETEVLLPPDMSVQAATDVALSLQSQVEDLEGVERCFVQVDYTRRGSPRHKADYRLHEAISSGSLQTATSNGLPLQLPG